MQKMFSFPSAVDLKMSQIIKRLVHSFTNAIIAMTNINRKKLISSNFIWKTPYATIHCNRFPTKILSRDIVSE